MSNSIYHNKLQQESLYTNAYITMLIKDWFGMSDQFKLISDVEIIDFKFSHYKFFTIKSFSRLKMRDIQNLREYFSGTVEIE